MLVNLDMPWFILGHSERRALLNESNEFFGDKVAYALAQGLKVIACVGETLEQREAGSTMDVVAAQTKAIAVLVSTRSTCIATLVRQYMIGVELVKCCHRLWTSADHLNRKLPQLKLTKKWLAKNVGEDVAATTHIIYGGSVNSGNCQELDGQTDVDGFLVGGPSLKKVRAAVSTYREANESCCRQLKNEGDVLEFFSGTEKEIVKMIKTVMMMNVQGNPPSQFLVLYSLSENTGN
ncbi:hypothetical protein HID58_090654 [Brassica napus]|uniref:Triosephosphate isomerase n=1 Tax=Brassica napus TaxID=3708 RepID=A0ABQ7XEG3_BRANA|nr:hypothetical protein HID58_090654 [Brassica napus]